MESEIFHAGTEPLNHSIKSYLSIFLVDIVIGCFLRLLDYCLADALGNYILTEDFVLLWLVGLPRSLRNPRMPRSALATG